MKRKQGISLIVLVITIIVMIILAASVVITLSNSEIINKANDAVSKTNIKEVEQLASLTWAEEFMLGKRGDSLKTAVLEKLKDYTDDYNIEVTDKGVTVKDKNGNTQTSWRIEREYDDNCLITKAVVTDGNVEYEIGMPVNYMPEGVGSTAYKGGWKLLGVDDKGRLLIMSNDSINGSTVRLSGQEGFLNGLTTLENAVSGYKDGTIGVDVRSVTVEDIDAVTGYDKTTFTGNEFLDIFIAMGMTEEQALEDLGVSTRAEAALIDNNMSVTYSWDGTEYPKYSYIKNGVTATGNLSNSHNSKGFTYYDKTTNTFKTAAYTTTPGTIATVENDMHMYLGPLLKYAEDSKAAKMFFMTADASRASRYWLASRCVGAFPNHVLFGMCDVVDGLLGGSALVDSNCASNDYSNAVRAVVTLADGVSLVENEDKTMYYIVTEDLPFFTIRGDNGTRRCKFMPGMTWKEWLESSYNTLTTNYTLNSYRNLITVETDIGNEEIFSTQNDFVRYTDTINGAYDYYIANYAD